MANQVEKIGNYSTNYQQTGRELLTPDEVRLLDNDYSLLFIRGERPIFDKKYDILKHPNVKYTKDGKAKPYEHGKVKYAIVDWQNVLLTDEIMNFIQMKIIEEYFERTYKKRRRAISR